jgi:hypothetical protein
VSGRGRGRRWGAVAVAVAVVVALAACGGADSDQDEPAVPLGYVEIRDAETGFAVAIPQEWQVPRNAEALQRQADAVREQNPRLAEVLSSAKALVAQGKVFALHPDGSSSVNLVVSPSPGADLEDIPGPAVDDLRRHGAIVERQERTTFGGHKAIKVVTKLPVTADVTVSGVQYYVVKRGKTFIFTLTGHDPALDVIARSVRLN